MKPLTLETMNELKEQNPHWWFVPVTPSEWRDIQAKGISRNKNGQRMGLKSTTIDLSDDFNIRGYAGEFACARVYNIPIEAVNTSLKQILDKIADLGGFVESKTASSSAPYLWNLIENVSSWKPNRAYVLTLTCLLPHWLVVVGWAWSSEVKAGEVRKMEAGHDGYLLKREKLRNPVTLFDELRLRPNVSYTGVGKINFTKQDRYRGMVTSEPR